MLKVTPKDHGPGEDPTEIHKFEDLTPTPGVGNFGGELEYSKGDVFRYDKLH